MEYNELFGCKTPLVVLSKTLVLWETRVPWRGPWIVAHEGDGTIIGEFREEEDARLFLKVKWDKYRTEIKGESP